MTRSCCGVWRISSQTGARPGIPLITDARFVQTWKTSALWNCFYIFVKIHSLMLYVCLSLYLGRQWNRCCLAGNYHSSCKCICMMGAQNKGQITSSIQKQCVQLAQRLNKHVACLAQ